MGNYVDEQLLIETNNLSSKRWKVRRIRTARDRKLRCRYKEFRRVWEVIRNLGFEELTPPVQQGYKRLFVLTEETKYSSKAEFYQHLLDKINTIWYSQVKTFKRDKKRKISKWKYKNRQEQLLDEPSDSAFRQKGKFTEEEALCFTPIDFYDYRLRRWEVKYVFNEPWRFVLRVRPNIITQRRRKDLELEQYRDELSDWLDRNRGRVVKLINGGNTNSWHTAEKRYSPKMKYRNNPLENKSIHEIMEMYKEEKQLWEYEPKI